MGFGDNVIKIPANTQHYETTLPMTYNGVAFRVVVTLDLNPATGMVNASFQSLNAATLMAGLAVCPGTMSLGPPNPQADLPPEVLTGFLPPEDGTGRGMGYITYTVKPKSSVVTGTQISNVADVTFDRGLAIATNQVNEMDPSKGTDPDKEAMVTIDAVAPTSMISSLPASFTGPFQVSWSGQDDAGGSGIGSYDIYVSDNGGAYALWLSHTADTSAMYIPTPGHDYRFYSVAIDNAGNTEPAPAIADAETMVPPSTVVGRYIFYNDSTYRRQRPGDRCCRRWGDRHRQTGSAARPGGQLRQLHQLQPRHQRHHGRHRRPASGTLTGGDFSFMVGN